MTENNQSTPPPLTPPRVSPPPLGPNQKTAKDNKNSIIIIVIVACVLIPIVIAIMGIMVAIAVPGFLKAREKAQTNACLQSQDKLSGATDNWALDEAKKNGDIPTWDDLVGNDKYLKETPYCPLGAPLEIIPVGGTAKCPFGEHQFEDY